VTRRLILKLLMRIASAVVLVSALIEMWVHDDEMMGALLLILALVINISIDVDDIREKKQ
jgi:uncharacterized membrane protein YoaK (UPF0700 family)